MMRIFPSAVPAALIGLAAATAQAAADAPVTAVELNRLEAQEGSCRVYLLFDNRAPAPYEALRLDLIFFGKDGVIARRLAVDAAPLRADKRTVKLFDVAGLDCGDVGQILVNDVLACRDGSGGERADCIEDLALSSRVADVPLTK